MKEIARLRPSPSFVLALVALVVAATGVAIAQPGTSDRAKPVTSKKVRKIATKISDTEITAKAPTLSVASAAKATSANNATTADSANPIAFAHVSALGAIDPARSKNMAGATVDRPSDGLYCFRGLPFKFKGAQVTTDFDDSTNEYGPQFGSTLTSTCSPAADAYVSMVISNGTATANGAFFIVFYN